jgi:hypothetical protein
LNGLKHASSEEEEEEEEEEEARIMFRVVFDIVEETRIAIGMPRVHVGSAVGTEKASSDNIGTTPGTQTSGASTSGRSKGRSGSGGDAYDEGRRGGGTAGNEGHILNIIRTKFREQRKHAFCFNKAYLALPEVDRNRVDRDVAA